MKKVLSTIAVVAMATGAFAQGYVNFNAGTAPIFQTNTAYSPLFGGSGIGGVSGSTIAGSGANVGAYLYALLVEPVTTPGIVSADTSVWDSTWTATGITTSNSVVSGRVTAGSSGILVSGVINSAAQGWVNGTSNNIVLVGWSANLGTSWAAVDTILQALALGNSVPLATQVGSAYAFFGESQIGYINPNAASPGAALFGSPNGVNGIPIDNLAANPAQLYLLQVPEPTTMALAGLGGLALVLFRRRK